LNRGEIAASAYILPVQSYAAERSWPRPGRNRGILVETICRMIPEVARSDYVCRKKILSLRGAIGPQDPQLCSLDELDLLGANTAYNWAEGAGAGNALTKPCIDNLLAS
jgi:hypothetical protein